MGWNLPPGCRESDLPGYNDIEVELSFTCRECGRTFEAEATVDARGSEAEAECECGETAFSEYEPPYYD